MGLASTVVQFVGKAKRLSGFVSPDCVPPCLLDAMATSGPAPVVEAQPKHDGLVQLQIRLELLRAQLVHLKMVGDTQKISSCSKELHTVLHHLMWLEVRK